MRDCSSWQHFVGNAILDSHKVSGTAEGNQRAWRTDEPDPSIVPAALTFLTMTTRPSFRAEFKAGEGGKTAVYMARWINTRGEKGPWSEITTATVAA
jgi:hypothetical protein